jgi:RHS repeat-associated protein
VLPETPFEPPPYREPLFSLRRPSRSTLTRFAAHLLIRILIVAPLPANLQAAAALFPVSMLWPLVTPDERASEQPACGPETRVRGYQPQNDPRTGGEAAQAAEPHRGYELGYGGSASDLRDARFYDPQLGRFITQDSYLGEADDPPSLHRYFYANDNPTRYIDPTGHWSWDGFLKSIGLRSDPVPELPPSTVTQEQLRAWGKYNREHLVTPAADTARATTEPTVVQEEQERPLNSGPLGDIVESVSRSWLGRKVAEFGERVEGLNEYVAGWWGDQAAAQAKKGLKPSENGVLKDRAQRFVADLDENQRQQLCRSDTGCAGAPPIAQGVQQMGTEATQVVVVGGVKLVLTSAEAAAGGKALEGVGGVAGRTGRALVREAEAGAPSRGGSGYQPLRGHPTDPNVPGGPSNYRGRFNAALDAEGQPRLPDSWDPHHTTPQRLRDPGNPQHDLARGIDMDHPSGLRGVAGSREPGSLTVREPSGRVRTTNPHQEMDYELTEFLKSNPTRQQLDAFTRYQDWRWGHLFWESGAGRP